MAKPGDQVIGGDVLGTVQETSVVLHKIMVPPNLKGTVESIQSGSYTVLDTVAVLVDDKGEKHELTLVQKWPVRVGRPYKHKYAPRTPLLSGQRIVDALFPVAKMCIRDRSCSARILIFFPARRAGNSARL